MLRGTARIGLKAPFPLQLIPTATDAKYKYTEAFDDNGSRIKKALAKKYRLQPDFFTYWDSIYR
jgi:hypothetical protein